MQIFHLLRVHWKNIAAGLVSWYVEISLTRTANEMIKGENNLEKVKIVFENILIVCKRLWQEIDQV